jgi:hypothetical protein
MGRSTLAMVKLILAIDKAFSNSRLLGALMRTVLWCDLR